MAKDELINKFKYIGTRPNRPDGLDKVTGRAKYGADFNAPNMLHAAVLRSPHAHARIVKIDTSKAEALSGVKAFVTRADFPTGAHHIEPYHPLSYFLVDKNLLLLNQ